MTRVLVTVLVLLAAVLPALEYAAAARIGGHDARITHAPRAARGTHVVALTSVAASSIAPLPAAGAVPAPSEPAPASRPLAAPFVPPRG
ncbi:MAG TPA: hypothetical protein VGT02_18825 [Methylomirabilota bacterium]|nr:hypothetical protein [Methylomirabilota bacterium]